MGRLVAMLITTLWVSVAHAGIESWSDQTICRLVEEQPDTAAYLAEAVARGLPCGSGKEFLDPRQGVKRQVEGGLTVLAAADVSDGAIKITRKWLKVAEKNWFQAYPSGSERRYPIILTIVGNNEKAAVELEDALCELIQTDYPATLKHSRCRADYKPSNCRVGRCYIAQYAIEGGASISSSRMNDGFFLMIMSGKNPPPSHPDWKTVVLHESFHIYQLSQISTKNRDLHERKVGRRTGDHDRDVPWWSEGTAEYMGLLLYSRQPNVSSRFLKNKMGDLLGYHGQGSAPVIKEYFSTGTKLYNIDYGEHRRFGYTVGPWFVAFLVNQVGESQIHEFYADVDGMDFEKAFIKHFGKPYRDYVDEFEVFLDQPIRKLLKIIP